MTLSPEDRAYYTHRRDEWLERAKKARDRRTVKECEYMAQRYDRLANLGLNVDDAEQP